MEAPALDLFTIAIVDDATSVREAIDSLVRARGYVTLTFESAEDFIQSGRVSDIDCLIVDLWLPGVSGLALHDRLSASGIRIPTVLISAQLDEATSAQARKAGIVRCLHKPFADEALLEAVAAALATSVGAVAG
jgi:FixJ family two-component response regulator